MFWIVAACALVGCLLLAGRFGVASLWVTVPLTVALLVVAVGSLGLLGLLALLFAVRREPATT